MPILFYTPNESYGFLSNFSPHGFELDGKYWQIAEHYFQAQKFVNTPYEEIVSRARTPREANKLGWSRSVPIRKDWEDVKDDIMRKAVLRKFETHEKLRRLLLGTDDTEIIEKSTIDSYWGCGLDGNGKNMLGTILIETRSILRQRESEKQP